MGTTGSVDGNSHNIGEDVLRALDQAPAGIVVTDPRRPGNPVVHVNDEFTRITGYPAEEILGQSLRRLQGPESDPTAIAHLRLAVAEKREATAELINYRKTGEPFLMRVHIRPVADRSGAISAYVGVVADATENRRADIRLRQSEERLRAVIEAVPLSMLILRPGGIIVQANDGAHQTLGAGADSLPGRDVNEFLVPGDEGVARIWEMLSAGGAVWRVETRIHRADGALLWGLASARHLDVHGESLNLLVFQDVTALKQKEEALTKANEEAEKALRARIRFLATASHDLRQPLQALALFASALDHQVQGDRGRAIVQSMKTSLRAMEEMFDSLLDMSKLDAGVMKAEPQIFQINDVMDRLETTYGPQAAAAGLTLRLVPSSQTIYSDPRMLARILGNFLSNAIRYTREGRILMGARLKGRQLHVCVCDTGPGIPEDQQLAIFREYRQGDMPRTGRDGGTGLGLAIVRRLALLLNHRLGLRSVVGRGSCFSIDVPLAEETLPAGISPPSHEEPRDVTGATVVVVDDDPDIQDGLKMLLTDWGCQPVVGDCADNVVKELSERGLKPDLILADLHLDERAAGVKTIRIIRTATGTQAPAFLFTGDTEAPGDYRGTGEFRVLRKPIDPLALRSMLADALGR